MTLITALFWASFLLLFVFVQVSLFSIVLFLPRVLPVFSSHFPSILLPLFFWLQLIRLLWVVKVWVLLDVFWGVLLPLFSRPLIWPTFIFPLRDVWVLQVYSVPLRVVLVQVSNVLFLLHVTFVSGFWYQVFSVFLARATQFLIIRLVSDGAQVLCRCALNAHARVFLPLLSEGLLL